MKNKYGITFTALVITMIIIVILLSGIIIGYDNIRESTLKRDFAHEIYTIEKLVEEYDFRYSKYPTNSEITINLSNVPENEKFQFQGEPGFDDGTITLNILNYVELGIENLNYGTGKTSLDYYAISKETGKVYYAAGDEIGDRIYYTLTDELAGLVDVIHSTDNTYNN